MLTPDYLFNCTDRIVEIYEQLQQFAINDICRRLVKTGRITDTALWQIQQAQEAGLHMEELRKQIIKTTGLSQTEVKRLFEDAAVESLSFDNAIYKQAGLSPLPISQSPAMLAVLESSYRQTNGELQNFVRSIANASQRTFFAASDRAYWEVSSGMSDYVSAISRAVRQTAQDGIMVINYRSRAKISVEAGVRRAVLTGVSQGAAKVAEAQADDMGCDLVEVTSHANARPSHALWQGRIYSRSGKSEEYPDFKKSTGYGTGAGLCGWNCRHSFFPFFEGVSVPAATQYNPEEVQRKYDLSQQQRGMERRIRNTKRELLATDSVRGAASGDLADAMKTQYDTQAVKLKRQREEYKAFCEKHNLYTENERSQIPGFGRSEASRATEAAKRVANSANKSYNFGESENINKYLADQKIRDRLRSDAQIKTINPEKQGRHIPSSDLYKSGRSYLTVSESETQELVNRYAGTGRIERTRTGAFADKELIAADKNIGVNINLETGEETPTNRFYIHYSKTGVHIVPTLKGAEKNEIVN